MPTNSCADFPPPTTTTEGGLERGLRSVGGTEASRSLSLEPKSKLWKTIPLKPVAVAASGFRSGGNFGELCPCFKGPRRQPVRHSNAFKRTESRTPVHNTTRRYMRSSVQLATRSYTSMCHPVPEDRRRMLRTSMPNWILPARNFDANVSRYLLTSSPEIRPRADVGGGMSRGDTQYSPWTLHERYHLTSASHSSLWKRRKNTNLFR